MYIKRKLEKKILDNLGSREYLAIVGPRQAGKTTLIQKIQIRLANSIYLSFEDRELLALFDRDIKLFAKEYAKYKYIFIDEFQYSQIRGWFWRKRRKKKEKY
jgi:predicted AAA+ superfamily ATPase